MNIKVGYTSIIAFALTSNLLDMHGHESFNNGASVCFIPNRRLGKKEPKILVVYIHFKINS